MALVEGLEGGGIAVLGPADGLVHTAGERVTIAGWDARNGSRV
jgi:hypothetical protein